HRGGGGEAGRHLLSDQGCADRRDHRGFRSQGRQSRGDGGASADVGEPARMGAYPEGSDGERRQHLQDRTASGHAPPYLTAETADKTGQALTAPGPLPAGRAVPSASSRSAVDSLAVPAPTRGAVEMGFEIQGPPVGGAEDLALAVEVFDYYMGDASGRVTECP